MSDATKFHPMPAVVRWRRVGYNSVTKTKPLDWTAWHKVKAHDGALGCGHEIPESKSMLFMPAYDYDGMATCKGCLRGES